MKPPENIQIFDTTLRDGEQSPGFSMNVEEKLKFAQQLAALGVDAIEAGFPIASEGDFEGVRLIATKVRGPEIVALARAETKDIDRAWEAIKGAKRCRIHTFLATSDIHMKYKLKKTRDQILDQAVRAVRHARRYTDRVEFSPEDATRTDPDFLCKVVDAVLAEGAQVVNIPDTVGYTVPWEFGELLRMLKTRVPRLEKAVLSVHCHNDLGLGVANSLSAIQTGARQVECTINGIGERAGNAALEEIVMAMRTRQDFFGFRTNVVSEQIYPTSRLLQQITGIHVQPNKAVVGSNAFAHESGIHQDGVLKKEITYEIMTPQSIGVPSNAIVLGKHSGRHAFRVRLKELGFALTDGELEQAFNRFKALADQKKEVYDEDLESLVAEQVALPREAIRLVSVNVSSGTSFRPTATVELEIDGRLFRESSFGDGPVDATYQAISKMTRTRSRLERYQVNAITGGTEAQGEVSVHLEEGDLKVVGRGAHTDIIVASARAYVNALNKLEYRKGLARRRPASVRPGP